MSFVETVDARGKRCPMPVLMAKRAIAGREQGESIEVLTTDPAAQSDFETFAKLEGHRVSWEQREEVLAIALTLYAAGAGAGGSG